MSRLRIATVMVLSITLVLTCWNEWWMVPVRLFVTMLHEAGHALACVLTGGEVTKLQIFEDGSGQTLTRPALGTQIFVDSGGYLGSAIFGSLLISLSTVGFLRRVLHHVLAVVIFALSMLLVRDLFTLGITLGFCSFLIVGVDRLSEARRQEFFLAIGTMTGVFALIDIKNLFLVTHGTVGGKPSLSDAQALAAMTGIPAIVWSVVWAAIALWCLWSVTRRVFQPTPDRIDTPVSDSYS